METAVELFLYIHILDLNLLVIVETQMVLVPELGVLF